MVCRWENFFLVRSYKMEFNKIRNKYKYGKKVYQTFERWI